MIKFESLLTLVEHTDKHINIFSSMLLVLFSKSL